MTNTRFLFSPSSLLSSSSPLIIGDDTIKHVMAPMVAASDYPFRKLVRSYNNNETPILGYTQMLHAKNLINDPHFRKTHFDFRSPMDLPLLESQKKCLQGWINNDNDEEDSSIITKNHQGEGGPLIVQLAGNDPSMVVDAAHIVLEQHANSNNKEGDDEVISGIDLNLGCPQGIARKGNYGAFLFEEDEDLVYTILQQLRLSLPSSIKVSAKIRLPLHDDHENDDNRILRERITKLITKSGIDFLTIHGRTLKENKVAVGACRHDSIQTAVKIAHDIQSDFPIIANGGIETYTCIEQVLQQTSASAIMSSEALLETPNLFSPTSLQNQNKRQQFRFAKDYLQLCYQYPPLPGVLGDSFNIIRGHLFKFLHRYIKHHPDLRTRLAKQTNTLQDAKDLIQELEQRIIHHDADDHHQFGSPSSSWYRRHWNAKNMQNYENNRRRRREGTTTTKEEQLVSTKMTLKKKKQQIQDRIQTLRQQKLARMED